MKTGLFAKLDLPKDVTNGCEIIRILGDGEIFVHNYEKIYCCTSDCIRFRCKRHMITISGKKLEIPFYTREQMQIVGKITSIQFQ